MQGGIKTPETFLEAVRGAVAMMTESVGSARVDIAQPFSLQVGVGVFLVHWHMHSALMVIIMYMYAHMHVYRRIRSIRPWKISRICTGVFRIARFP